MSGAAMLVSISVDDSISVVIDTETQQYDGPDVADDLVNRTRDLFRLAMADMQHLHTEHDPS